MAAKTGIRSTLSALALGTALLALPGAALAQEDHRDHGNGAPHQQEAPRPAPAAPAPRAAPAAPAAPRGGDMRGGDMRGGGQWNGQARPAPGSPAANGPAGNGWQGRGGQPNYAPGQGRPPQGQPAYQGQPRGDGGPGRNDGDQRRGDGGPGHNDGGQWRGDNGPGHSDGGQWRGDGGPGHNDGGPGRDDGRRGGPGYGQPGYGRGQPGGQWSHNWRQDNRYDWRGWRDHNRDTFHVGRYYPPYRDYAYNRLGIGFYVQPVFFGPDYWIADPWYYHLPPAYGPYHWVRYYNDVILVNTYTGQVADVIYDFFW
jgi:Ni/Co efflux regulator RcnB